MRAKLVRRFTGGLAATAVAIGAGILTGASAVVGLLAPAGTGHAAAPAEDRVAPAAAIRVAAPVEKKAEEKAAPKADAPAADSKVAVKPNEIEVRLADGSILRMVMLQETLEVATAFGKLSIPTLQVRRIDFGARLPAEITAKVEALIKKLGNDNFDTRESATNELIAVGAPAYPALRDASDSPDPETSQRARAAMRKIREKAGSEVLPTTQQDKIETNLFTVVGAITSPTIRTKGYFGEADLKVADLRGIRWLSANSEIEIALDVSKCSNNNQWFQTNISVEADAQILISASGQCNLNENGGGEFVSGPTGNNNWGQRGPYAPGTLLGKIGDKGPTFVIGEKLKTEAGGKEGKLFLQVAPSPWNKCTGTYKVKVLVGRNVADE